VTGLNGGQGAGANAGSSGAERDRLASDHAAWSRWGPYLAERAWGTVREDYSPGGTAWDYLPHEQARSRAYRWNEDGMAGVCDDQQRLCLALALWNGRDPILKERMFGLSGPQGRHGEDVKENWWYADAVPSHAWLRWQYAYPLDGYPYQGLIDGDAARGRDEPEFELLDTGVFDPEPDGVDGSARWADVTVEYAKAAPDDLVMRVRVENMSAHPATVHVLPTLWFRNTWAWGPGGARGSIRIEDGLMVARHPELGSMLLSASAGPDGASPRPLFCDNETNVPRVFRAPATTAWPKDGINDHVVNGRDTVNPALAGTKAALWYRLDLAGREAKEIVVRLTSVPDGGIGGPVPDTGDGARAVLAARRAEADEFHAGLLPASATDAERAVHRQAVAGLIWGKCFYHYDVDVWLDGDPYPPDPPPERLSGRNSGWRHLNNWDVLSMPDPWEYPWYAAWDLAFHTVALAHVDPRFAKDQLLLLLREWYMHPNGQLPAYEWAFGDVNPPVHAWAALWVFEIDGGTDYDFLEKVLHKLLLNFTWWVNRKDAEGNNLFEGGFLGMDNIGPIDRSNQVPPGYLLEQSDGTAWMAVYCLDLWDICLRLAAGHDPVYADLAIKFLEHFASIAGALDGSALWNEDDDFYYDVLTGGGEVTQLRVQSMVGLLPLFAVRVAQAEQLARAEVFRDHLKWFLENRPASGRAITGDQVARDPAGRDGAHLLSIVDLDRLPLILARVFDEAQFLAPTGVRSLSRAHREHPFELTLGGLRSSVDYEPAESRSGLFGGNSNWRGPVWFPVNHLLVESLRRFGTWTDGSLLVELPTGSGRKVSLTEAADELAGRLVSTFLPGPDGVRPFARPSWRRMPAAWRDRICFNEYFDGDTGAGLGASHQTGWTALVIDLLATLTARR
jgi:Mannosylglycerate hydrolase MGH1-like glycoside hydrolase domain